MIRREDIESFELTAEQRAICQDVAEKKSYYGRSHFRTAEDRMPEMGIDQWTGATCHLGGILCLTGKIDQFLLHKKLFTDAGKSDGGCDIPGLPLDVKGRNRNGHWDLMQYFLAIDPTERHQGWHYVGAVLDEWKNRSTVHVMGWIRDRDLPPVNCAAGVFEGFMGKHLVRVDQLQPIASLRTAVTRWLWGPPPPGQFWIPNEIVLAKDPAEVDKLF